MIKTPGLLFLSLFLVSTAHAAPSIGDCADGRPFNPCIIYVGPAGGGECEGGYSGGDCDYQTVAAAETANDTNISTGQYPVIFRGYNVDDGGGGVYILGWTTSETYRVTVQGAPADRTGEMATWSTNRWRLTSSGQGIVIAENHVTIDGLQVETTSTTSEIADINGITAGSTIIFKDNIFRLNNAGDSNDKAINFDDGDANGSLVYNNIIYATGGGKWASAIDVNGTATGVLIYNNVIEDSYLGIVGSGAGSVCSNNVINVDTTCYAANCPGDNNVCNLAQSPSSGSNNQASATCTFAGAGDFHLDSGDTVCTDNGKDLSGAFTLDIDGETRFVDWEAGADDTTAASGSRRIIITGWMGL